MSKKRHPKKEIRAAVDYAISQNWILKDAGKSAHIWGKLMCPYGTRENGCIIFVNSTPRVAENHAKSIVKSIDRCNHKKKNVKE